MTPTGRIRSRFGDLLLEMRLLEEGPLSAALAEQRDTGRRLARVLSDRGLLDEDRLAKAVGAKLGLETIDLTDVRIHPRVLERIPADIASRHGILPYAVKRTAHSEVLYLVMSDPLDAEALKAAQRSSRCQVRVMVAAATALDDAIELHYKAARRAAVAEAGGNGAPRSVSSSIRLPPARVARAPSSSARLPSSSSSSDHSSRDPGDSIAIVQGAPLSSGGSLLRGPDPWASEPPNPAPSSAPAVEPEGRLIDLPARRRGGSGAGVEGASSAGAIANEEPSSVPTQRPKVGGALEEFEQETLDISEVAEVARVEPRLATSAYATELDPRPSDPHPPAPRAASSDRARPANSARGPDLLALEVPVAYVMEASHPFQGPSLADVPVGLGETGIIPEVDPHHEPFEPPPPEAFPVEVKRRRGLAASDIPTNATEVAARGGEPDLDEGEEIEEIHLDALDDDLLIEDVTPIRGGGSAVDPELSRLVDSNRSEGAAGAPALDAVPAEAVDRERPETSTPASSPLGAAVVEGSAGDVSAPSGGAAAADREAPPATAERLVATLEAGGDLSRDELDRLVVALARTLLDRGLLRRDVLVDALSS